MSNTPQAAKAWTPTQSTRRLNGWMNRCVVGWQMMAMKSAMTADLNIRQDVVRKVDSFLDSQQRDYGAFYGYRSKQREPCTTAIGLLMRLYRGWPMSHPSMIRGSSYIADLGPASRHAVAT